MTQQDATRAAIEAQIELPPFPKVQVPRVDADIDLMDIKRLADWCERTAKDYARAALQSQKPEPNDLMLSAVIRMPFEMAMASEISRLQFYQRAQQALDELEALQSQDREVASHRALWAGVTVWIGDKQRSYGVTREELELFNLDALQIAFGHASHAIVRAAAEIGKDME